MTRMQAIGMGVAGALALLVMSCAADEGETSRAYTPPCGPSNCTGCCNAADQCITTPSASFCGRHGAYCVSCGPGQSCSLGTCVDDVCSPSNCAGCCQNGQCVSGDLESACGTGGIECSICKANESCVTGACVASSVCDANNCGNGCCIKGVCMPGRTGEACGKGGIQCEQCSEAQQCEDQVCRATVCDADSCKNGCCYQGKCMAGTSAGACGTGGVPCKKCSDGEQCPKGSCVTVTCDASTCSGC
ncbi:MAG TPA: hypothetical protein PLV85_15080, partial [Polyangiaceae bacterium]|nr:hypothetical protein [Polyangiaceae bacterium]